MISQHPTHSSAMRRTQESLSFIRPDIEDMPWVCEGRTYPLVESLIDDLDSLRRGHRVMQHPTETPGRKTESLAHFCPHYPDDCIQH